MCPSANTSGLRPAVQARRPIRLALPLLLVAGLGFALLHYSGHLDAVSCRLHALPRCAFVSPAESMMAILAGSAADDMLTLRSGGASF